MSEKNSTPSYADLITLTEEIAGDNGPGTKGWKAKESKTMRINAKVIRALRENKGNIPGDLESFADLILTTTGARTGNRYTVPLAYHIINQRLLVVAAMGGARRNPPWFHNLVKNPVVLIEKDGEHFMAKALVTQSDDRNFLYQKICENLPPLADYQANIDRIIPVVELQRK